MRRKIATMFFSIFFLGTVKKRAIATGLGASLSFLPFQGYGWLLGFLLAFLFGLNVWAMLLGFGIYLFVMFIWFLAVKGLQIPIAFSDLSLILQVSIGCLVGMVVFFLCLWIYQESNKNGENDVYFVFRDRGRRAHFTKQIIIFSVIVILLSSSIFVQSLFEYPTLSPHLADTKSPIYKEWKPDAILKAEKEFVSSDPSLHATNTSKQNNKLTRYGFYVPWDVRSWVDLSHQGVIDQLDVLIPEWYSIEDDYSVHIERQAQVDRLAKQKNVSIMPLLNNVHNDEWDGEFLHQILVSPAKRSQIIQTLLQDIQQNGYKGINVDFEAVLPKDRKLLVTFMRELATVFHQHGLKVTQDIPASQDPAFDVKSLSEVVDQLIVMMYDYHYAAGEPGSIASLGWVNQTMDQLDIPKEKMVVSLGNYGYDWIVGRKSPAMSLSYDEIMERASSGKIPIRWDAISKTPYLAYQSGKEKHFISFLDAASFYNQWKLAQQKGAAGIALWRIGTEDPSIWRIFDKKLEEPALVKGSTVKSNVPLFIGEGEIIHIKTLATTGTRQWQTTPSGWVKAEYYTKLPIPTTIKLSGKPDGKVISLTFDDGPDPSYTGEILDILKRNGVKATFFVIGQNAVQNPALIKRIEDEGHEIGNHTYTHAEVSKISSFQFNMELNATQRFVQQVTGKSMTLYRSPYQADAMPTTMVELLPIWRAQQLGYTMVGESIDTTDWKLHVSTDAIVKAVYQGLDDGNVILMHDAGGDRSKTVEALPKILNTLKRDGYQFVTVNQLLQKKSSQVQPDITQADKVYQPFDTAIFSALKVLRSGYTTFLYLMIGIGFIRVLFLMYFSFRQRRVQQKRSQMQNSSAVPPDFLPTVTVVIAAYNEQEVISRTISSVLNSNYPDLEIIVVNDGSTDHTAEIIDQDFGHLSIVKVITKPNEGKTAAINLGYQQATGEIIVSLDADTLIAKDAISLMVRHFVDDKIAAVSGNVKVGNMYNLLTQWQHVEYVTGFNLERRAYDHLNSIPVVPGAIGAWRKSAIEEAGYFPHDTLAEDTDITLSLLRLGYQVKYEDKALAFTEAPSDIKSFIKQRTRWIYGTLQCLWKHRGAIFSGSQKTLGYITIPNMWLFQYGVQLLSPFVDLLCVISFFTIYVKKTLLFYLLFLIFDMLVAFFAFGLEKENPKPLVWLFLQRFVYRQLMSYVVIKSLYYAFRGRQLGWNKLKRQGNVSIVTNAIEK